MLHPQTVVSYGAIDGLQPELILGEQRRLLQCLMWSEAPEYRAWLRSLARRMTRDLVSHLPQNQLGLIALAGSGYPEFLASAIQVLGVNQVAAALAQGISGLGHGDETSVRHREGGLYKRMREELEWLHAGARAPPHAWEVWASTVLVGTAAIRDAGAVQRVMADTEGIRKLRGLRDAALHRMAAQKVQRRKGGKRGRGAGTEEAELGISWAIAKKARDQAAAAGVRKGPERQAKAKVRWGLLDLWALQRLMGACYCKKRSRGPDLI